MSTHVFVTRKPDPLEEDGQRITDAEWASLIASDSDLRVPTESELEPVRRWVPDTDRPAIWLAHPDSEPIWLTLSDGSIETKNPDEPVLAKMGAIARALSARVISESGEAFDHDGRSLGLPQDPPEPSFWRRFVAWWHS